MIRPGRMNGSFRFERRQPVTGGMGQKSDAWYALAISSAEIRETKSTESVTSKTESGGEAIIFRVYFQSALFDLSTGDRAIDLRSNDIFNIKSVRNMGRKNRVLEIAAEMQA